MSTFKPVPARVPTEAGAEPGSQLQPANRGRPWPPPLPRRLAYFETEYLAMADSLAADMGGLENMTTGQRALAAATLEVSTIRRKLGRNLLSRGVVRRNGELRQALASYFTACNTERLNWLALGLERRARDVGQDIRTSWHSDSATQAAGGRDRQRPSPKGERAAGGEPESEREQP